MKLIHVNWALQLGFQAIPSSAKVWVWSKQEGCVQGGWFSQSRLDHSAPPITGSSNPGLKPPPPTSNKVPPALPQHLPFVYSVKVMYSCLNRLWLLSWEILFFGKSEGYWHSGYAQQVWQVKYNSYFVHTNGFKMHSVVVSGWIGDSKFPQRSFYEQLL